jgi:IS30 family transposase
MELAMSNRKVRTDKFLITETSLVQIEKLAGLGMNMEQIASVLNISPDTLYRRMKEGEFELSAAILRGRTLANMKVAEKAYELALAGDVSMIKYILSSKAGWTEKSQIIHEGLSQNVTVIVGDQLKKMAEEVLLSQREDENE